MRPGYDTVNEGAMTTSQRIENQPAFERYVRFLESMGACDHPVEIRVEDLMRGVEHYERGVKLCTKRAQELGIVQVIVHAAYGEGRRPNAYKLSMGWDRVAEKLPQWAEARRQVKVRAAEKRAAERKAKGLRPHGTRIKRDPVTIEPEPKPPARAPVVPVEVPSALAAESVEELAQRFYDDDSLDLSIW
jgi:hypothetical protein